MSILDFSVAIPGNYRMHEVLSFHGRDPLQLAESVEDGVLRKGLMLDGNPALLTIKLNERAAHCKLELDGDDVISSAALNAIVEGVLGLHLQSEPFEAMVASDTLLGAIVAKQRGLRIPQTATAFEALTWAIIGQQIGLGFAITLRRRFIEYAGMRHSSGLACYPDATRVARMNADELGRLQFSRAKSEALIRVAQFVEEGKLDLAQLALIEPEAASAQMIAIKGIGPWTANYVLMRGLGAADCSLHGDAAVRAAIVKIMLRECKLDQAEAQRMLRQYSPWRSLAAAHLWASLTLPA